MFHIGSKKAEKSLGRKNPMLRRWIWAMERVWAEIPSSNTATALEPKVQVLSNITKNLEKWRV